MVEVRNIEVEVTGVAPIRNRGPHTSEAEVSAAFKRLGEGNFKDARLAIGSFDGNAGWERHLGGEELVQIVAGATEFDLILDDEIRTLDLVAGSLVVVPQGCWHRFRSAAGVTILAATPAGDEPHLYVDDPRDM